MTKLNPNFVLHPFKELLGNCQNNVLLGLRLVEKIENFPEPTPEELQFMQLYFNGHITEINQSKSLFKQWVLKNGFEDIHNYIRTTLERLYVFKNVEAEIKKGSTIKVDELEIELIQKANKLNFPVLIEKITNLFDEPLDYQKHIESINNARNCFIHRNGIVGEKDINNAQIKKLEIIGNRFKLFFKKGDQEVIAEFGKPGPENAALMLGGEEFIIDFDIKQKIDISLKQFIDILITCVFFNADLEVRFKK